MQLPAERLLRELAAVAKLDQRRHVARADPERLERLGEAVHRDAAELDHEEHRPLLGDAWRGRLSCVLWHAPKVITYEPFVTTNDLIGSCDLATRRQPPPSHRPRRPLARRHLVCAPA